MVARLRGLGSTPRTANRTTGGRCETNIGKAQGGELTVKVGVICPLVGS